jgi:hypothetical protein
VSSNQFSVTRHFRSFVDGENDQKVGLPGVFIFYEFSPIMVDVRERRRPFFHLIAQACAIVGGVFTVAGVVDRLLYRGLKTVEKKLLAAKTL